MEKLNPQLNKGLTIVEVVIASAIILGAVLALLGVHNLYFKVALSNGDTVKAAYLAEEGIEALRFLRDSSWSGSIEVLSVDTAYGMVFDGANWQESVSDKFVGGFERTVVISDVYRDSSGDIVSAGGTLDANTKLAVSSVSWWDGSATTTKSISTYLANIYDN